MASRPQLDVYCPMLDLTARYPDWTWHETNLHALDEVIDSDRRTILIDPGNEHRVYALAHAIVHLDYDLDHPCTAFSLEQEQAANDIAELRLSGWLKSGAVDWPLRVPIAAEVGDDDFPDDIPIDGEPTVRL